MKNKNITVYATYRYALCILILLFSPILVYAVPSYEVAPLVIDVDAEARDILEYDITLTNTGSQPITVYPVINNISIENGGTAEPFQPPVRNDRTSSLTSWIEIPRSGIKLPVGESHTITMTLHIHPDPIPGEYHARIAFGSGRNQPIAEEQVKMGRAPSTVLNVTIQDTKNELLKLSRFFINRFIMGRGNQAATYTITNPGDTVLTPSGEIIFYDNKGVEVSSLPVNGEHLSVPAGEEKEFNLEVPVDGLFGKYKAFLSVEYGDTQLASVQDTTFFYVFPLRTVLIILSIILIFSAIVAFFVHKRYLGETTLDDADLLPFHIRDTKSDSKDHDIDLKQQ